MSSFHHLLLDNINPVSPAARKAKMAELREQQLAKRKGKGASTGIVQKNDAPKVVQSTTMGATSKLNDITLTCTSHGIISTCDGIYGMR